MRAAIMVIAAALLFSATARADDCQLKREAWLPITFDVGGRINVPAKLSGKAVVLGVDTGGDFSAVSERAADALGFRKERFTGSNMLLWGGERLTSYINVDEFQVGRTIFTKTQLYVIPDRYFPPGVDGIMGADVMSKFDVDFDFAGGKMNLFNRFHCAGKVVYWTDEANVSALPFKTSPRSAGSRRETDNHIMFYVDLDGKALFAVLDTGSPDIRLNMNQAQSLFDLAPESPGMTKVPHSDGTTSYRYTFKTMTFGGVSVANPQVTIDPYDVHQMPSQAPPVLIGMSVIRKLHLYIAYAERKIYVSAVDAH